jgi:phosphate-selective porin OprO/OprP
LRAENPPLPFVGLPAAQAPQPSVADLERRVAELEAVIRQMQTDRQTGPQPDRPAPAAGPGASPQGVAPDTGGGESVQQAQAGGSPPSRGPGEEPQPGPFYRSSTTGRQAQADTRGLTAGWINNAFMLKSADDSFRLRITGQIQTDYRSFLEASDGIDTDTFLLRRARLGLEADMFRYYEFRFLPDFGSGYLGTSAVSVQDAYLNVHYWDALQFEVGKFKQPLSYEQLIQDRYVPTVERSLIDQLTPQRDLGAMVHGYNLFGGRLDYQVAVSNGEINNSPAIDTNEHKDVNGRLALRPLHGLGPVVDWLQIGVSAGIGIEQEGITPNPLRTPQTIPWFTYNAGVQEYGVRWRLTPEATYFYHGLGLAAQYYREDEKLRPVLSGPGSAILVDVPYNGYYVLGTLLLTGEERTTYSAPIAPLRPFNPCHPFTCPGAWELVARVSQLDVGGEVFTPFATSKTTFVQLANPATNSREATEMTLGFNWYLNAWVRVQCNYEHDWFGQPVQLGGSAKNLTRDADALTTRFEVIF